MPRRWGKVPVDEAEQAAQGVEEVEKGRVPSDQTRTEGDRTAKREGRGSAD